jgi:hypothetical protein
MIPLKDWQTDLMKFDVDIMPLGFTLKLYFFKFPMSRSTNMAAKQTCEMELTQWGHMLMWGYRFFKITNFGIEILCMV